MVITLSNLGDIILTTPVIKVLSEEFPGARIDIMVGPNGKEIFERDPRIFKLIIYDKHMPIQEKRRLQLKLRRLKYGLVVDIRNTIFPILIGPKYRTPTIQKFPRHITHSKTRHLHRLTPLGINKLDANSYIHIPDEDVEYISRLLEEHKISDKIVVVNPGAKSHLKRWTPSGFAELCDKLIEDCAAQIILVGVKEDEAVINDIITRMKKSAHNFVGKTNTRQLAGLLKKADLLITNDSAPLHLGCAVGAKVLALFGPTDPKRYGPTGEFDIVINKKLFCSPCERAVCKYDYECMKLISPEEVIEAAKMMIEGYE